MRRSTITSQTTVCGLNCRWEFLQEGEERRNLDTWRGDRYTCRYVTVTSLWVETLWATVQLRECLLWALPGCTAQGGQGGHALASWFSKRNIPHSGLIHAEASEQAEEGGRDRPERRGRQDTASQHTWGRVGRKAFLNRKTSPRPVHGRCLCCDGNSSSMGSKTTFWSLPFLILKVTAFLLYSVFKTA